MARFLTDRPLDLVQLLAEVCSPQCGGTAFFLGTVRNSPEDGNVEAIDYTAYDQMAEAEFERVVKEALARWPAARIAVRHRTGRVPAGQASIAIAVACPHRAEAFDACRFIIEETKRRVPIWKKEHLASGETRWVEPAGRGAPSPSAADRP
jgi:molybdopterin synthase catalytic subunit